jgi:hypothetical protein
MDIPFESTQYIVCCDSGVMLTLTGEYLPAKDGSPPSNVRLFANRGDAVAACKNSDDKLIVVRKSRNTAKIIGVEIP